MFWATQLSLTGSSNSLFIPNHINLVLLSCDHVTRWSIGCIIIFMLSANPVALCNWFSITNQLLLTRWDSYMVSNYPANLAYSLLVEFFDAVFISPFYLVYLVLFFN